MGLFASILKSFIPKRKKTKRKRKSRTVRSGAALQPGSESNVRVLVSEIFGSGGKEVTERVAGALSSEATLTTLTYPKPLRLNLRLGQLERMALAREEGRTWLSEEKADFLIWGAMEDMGTVVRLYFLTRPREGVAEIFGEADSLTIPAPMPKDIGDLMRAVALAVSLPIATGSRKAILERLRELLKSAESSLDAVTTGAPEDIAASIHLALGNVYKSALFYGDKKAFAGAATHYEKADGLVQADTDAALWATLQNHFGGALEVEARLKKSPDIMAQAAEKYAKVTSGLDKMTASHDWATAHVRNAMVHYKLASMVPERMTQHLKSAATCFEEALTVFDKATVPFRWAEAMNHYGVVQMALGGQVTGEKLLQKSVDTFRQVLKVRRRDIQPLLWAQTANNLGAACVALAKRTNDKSLLNEAAVCFEGAMAAYAEDPKSQKRVQVISNNLDRVRKLQSVKAA